MPVALIRAAILIEENARSLLLSLLDTSEIEAFIAIDLHKERTIQTERGSGIVDELFKFNDGTSDSIERSVLDEGLEVGSRGSGESL